MMLPTHALAGMALAVPLAVLAPEADGVVLLTGFVGGIVPDLDMYVGHRRTLHYPVYYTVLAAVAVPLAVLATVVPAVAALVPVPVALAVAAASIGAAAHSVADIAGGGLELRPWEGTSDRAVYDHYRETWVAPRRWVRYDGAPEDALLSVLLAIPLLVIVVDPLRWLVLGTLVVGLGYAAVRRVLPPIAERVVGDVIEPVAPEAVLAHVPDRYQGGVETGDAAKDES